MRTYSVAFSIAFAVAVSEERDSNGALHLPRDGVLLLPVWHGSELTSPLSAPMPFHTHAGVKMDRRLTTVGMGAALRAGEPSIALEYFERLYADGGEVSCERSLMK